jgi:hypothetical protein
MNELFQFENAEAQAGTGGDSSSLQAVPAVTFSLVISPGGHVLHQEGRLPHFGHELHRYCVREASYCYAPDRERN